MSASPIKPKAGATDNHSVPPRPIMNAVFIPTRLPPGSCFKNVVTVEVGPEKQAFIIHKDLLCFYSDYFRGAFNGSFQEAIQGKLSLPEEQVDVFEIFNTFIYTRQICLQEDGSTTTWNLLCRLWVFGDKYLAPSLQNAAMDLFQKKITKENAIPAISLPYIYTNTLTGSPLRSIVLDLVAYRANIDKFLVPAKMQVWSQESLADLAKLLYNKETKTTPMPTGQGLT